MLFPREYPPSLKLDYVMILRFEPNERAESQLVVRTWHDGTVEATLFAIQDGTAWRVANAYIAQTGKENIEAIAGSIRVQRRSLNLSRPDVQKWHTLLFQALRASESALERSAEEYRVSGTREAVLDGGRYDLWYAQGETECHWSFSDVDISDAPERTNSPLAHWMNTVRIASTKNRQAERP
jgi:hypothetical protein